MSVIYRIQDASGRGPWKPGFSRFWVEDRADHDLLIPWYREFGNVHLEATAGMHVACGCMDVAQLRRWFLPIEYKRLVEFGYRAVQLDATRIIAGSDIQCVFERAKPLRIGAAPFDLYAPVMS